MKEENGTDLRTASRIPIKTRVEFFIDADIIDAESVNMSNSGIRFDTQTPIPIQMRLEKGGILHENRAQLVWAQSKADGGMTYGFQFVTSDESQKNDIIF
ncbi:MAG: PilZ domain-containing protein [Candidatus Magnetomorum sp.]|nr:PilZ domain-containing protein [Candidatus Magnetomorum sp.]